jgi:hypothetical protein
VPSGLPAASLVAKEATKTLDQGYKLETVCSEVNHTKFLRAPIEAFR